MAKESSRFNSLEVATYCRCILAYAKVIGKNAAAVAGLTAITTRRDHSTLTEQLRKEEMEDCSDVSTASTSFVNLFKSLPVGCESKKDIGRRRTVVNRDFCRLPAAINDPKTRETALAICMTKDTSPMLKYTFM